MPGISLHEILFWFTHYLAWRDIVEILFFAAIIYYFSLWLKEDRHKNLLGYFYSYCLVFGVAYCAQLTAITYILSLAFPFACMMFILMHQTTLQKNFIALRNILPARQETTDWLETIIRVCLISLNKNKEMFCIIEHSDSLATLLTTPLALQAPVEQELLNILLESPSWQSQHMLWINSQGVIQGINASWRHHDDQQPALPWHEEALFYSSKIDAVVLHCNPATRSFDVIIKGKHSSAMSATHTLTLIKQYLHTTHSISQGDHYVPQTQKYSAAQRNS